MSWPITVSPHIPFHILPIACVDSLRVSTLGRWWVGGRIARGSCSFDFNIGTGDGTAPAIIRPTRCPLVSLITNRAVLLQRLLSCRPVVLVWSCPVTLDIWTSDGTAPAIIRPVWCPLVSLITNRAVLLQCLLSCRPVVLVRSCPATLPRLPVAGLGGWPTVAVAAAGWWTLDYSLLLVSKPYNNGPNQYLNESLDLCFESREWDFLGINTPIQNHVLKLPSTVYTEPLCKPMWGQKLCCRLVFIMF